MSVNDLIKTLVNSINTTLNVVESVDNGDNTFSFVFAEVLWLRVGKTLTTENEASYKVISITGNKEQGFTVLCKLIKGSYDANALKVNIPKPFYFYGSIRMINGEVAKIRRSIDKVPMFYLRTLEEATFPNDKTERFLYNVPVELFILDEANFKDWISEDYESEIIEPLRSLLNAFIEKVEINEQAIEPEPYQIRPIIKFAREDDNGNVSKLFTDDLSGWRFRMSLNVKKPLNCCKDKKIKLKL